MVEVNEDDKAVGSPGQMVFYNVKNHLLGTGPICTRSQVCGGWRCPFPGHQVHGKMKGGCPGMTICPCQWVRPV